VRRLLERLGWSGVELGRHLGVGGGEGHHWATGGKRPDGPAVVLMMGLERAVARGRPSPPALVRTPGEFAPERVAAILGRSGWSVGELGRRCRVCASAVRKWRDGKRKPRGSTRVLLEQIEAEVMGRREGPRA
jgi:DNA-binding transcriptional regulator YiaG